jgi:hypothetical protein
MTIASVFKVKEYTCTYKTMGNFSRYVNFIKKNQIENPGLSKRKMKMKDLLDNSTYNWKHGRRISELADGPKCIIQTSE